MLGLAISALSLVAPVATAAEPSCDLSFELGREQFVARHYDQATGAFQQALQACPQAQQERLLLNLAGAQMMGQHVADCLVSINRLLHINPHNAAALKLQSDAYFLIGKELEAERSLLTARKIDPQNAELPYSLGRIYYQQHRYPEAVDQFQAAITIDPKFYKAYDNLGLCYEALNDPQQAIRFYVKALDLVYKDHRDYEWPYANLAELMIKLGDYRKAFDLASEAAFRNPQSARNFYLTGKALVKLEKWDLSLRWLKRANELDPKYAEPHYLLARVYRELGRNAEATRELETFREIAAVQPREHR